MRENVAALQDGEQVRFGRPVHHDRDAHLVGELPRRRHDRDVVLQILVPAAHAHLEAQDQVAVLLDDRAGGADVDQAGVEIDFVGAAAGRRDIQERVDPRARPLDDELPEAREHRCTGGPAIDDRRDARLDPDAIRIDAERRAVLVHMRVHVDQPRRDDLVRGVERAASLRVRDVLGDPGDPTVQDRDIAYGGQILPRVDHPAARNQEIVGPLGRRALGGGGNRRSGDRKRSRRQRAQRRENRCRSEPTEKCSPT